VNTSRRLVLIVDDDPGIQESLRAIFEFEGWQVELAPNGAVALEKIARQRPELVMLDQQMPVMDGETFAASLAQQGVRLPIVLMTAQSYGEDLARKIGATAYLAKPFDVAYLLDLLRLVLASA
jgi:CheY-like chemotaxis protein